VANPEYVVKRTDEHGECWFMGGPFDTPPRLSGAFTWGSEVNARRYPSKAAAKRALRGYRRAGATIDIKPVYAGVEGISDFRR
jgi:hypothetical protein